MHSLLKVVEAYDEQYGSLVASFFEAAEGIEAGLHASVRGLPAIVPQHTPSSRRRPKDEHV